MQLCGLQLMKTVAAKMNWGMIGRARVLQALWHCVSSPTLDSQNAPACPRQAFSRKMGIQIFFAHVYRKLPLWSPAVMVRLAKSDSVWREQDQTDAFLTSVEKVEEKGLLGGRSCCTYARWSASREQNVTTFRLISRSGSSSITTETFSPNDFWMLNRSYNICTPACTYISEILSCQKKKN